MAPHQPKLMLGWILKLCLVALLSNPTGVLGYTTNLRGAVKTTEADAADAHADAHADAEAEAVVSFDESFDEVPEMEEVELSEDEEEDEEEDEDEDEALEEDEDEDEALEEQEDEWEDEDEDFEKYILEDEDLSEEELMELREQRQLHPDHRGVIYSSYYHGNGLHPVNSFNGGVNSFNGGSISLNRPVRNNRFRFYNNYQYQANYIRPQASYWGSGSYLNQDRYYGYYSPYGTNGARYGPYTDNYNGYWFGN